MKNYSDSSTVSVDKTVTLNLNGKTISRQSAINITSSGYLKVNGGGELTSTSEVFTNNGDLQISISGKITGTGNAIPIYNKTGGNVEILSGTMTATTDNVVLANLGNAVRIYGGVITAASPINNQGNLTISGDAIIRATGETKSSAAIVNLNNGNVEILGGTITALNSHALWNIKGTATISGGTLNSSFWTIYNLGTMDISNGIITGSKTTIVNHGSMNIFNGTISAATGSAVVVNQKTLNFTGGTIISSQSKAVSNTGGGTFNMSGTAKIEARNMQDGLAGVENADQGGKIYISGGTITSTGKAIHNKMDTTLEITGGSINSSNPQLATITNQGGILNVLGGNIQNTSSYYAIEDIYGDGPAIRIGGDAISNTTPDIRTEGNYAVRSSVPFDFYGGRLQGSSNPPFSPTPNVRSGYRINTLMSGSKYYSILTQY